ncbi:CaiB/BaiF CoA transferase family protein [Nocardia aurea]|uniref:CaiB/BaiF CoA transferase family protein n=1 Tax=Nocardia aurea TaxID=2144174 RepID=UPI000D699630|nr:CoA transferase [Nocardia aurea]
MIRTRALSGLRVLDLGIITAGAATSQVLADFGADVIKVESTTYVDPFRNWAQIAGGKTSGTSVSPPFASANRGKRSVAIDLKTEAGKQIFLDLVTKSDVVVENFRRGVLERLGIGFEALQTANPRIVLLSLSSQGSAGPEAKYASFGSTLEALGGVMAMTGYGDGTPPVWTGNNVNYPDQLVSVSSPGLVLAALRARNATGRAVHVDAPQREAVTAGVGDTLVEYSMTGAVAAPRGNRHDRFAPQGVYPASGADDWIAISVQDDLQWKSLCLVLGLPSDSDGLGNVDERHRRHDEIDEDITAATRAHSAQYLAEELQHYGVPASAVLRPREVLDHPQLRALGFPVVVPDDEIVQRGFVARLHSMPGVVSRRAPRLGEHTREVLSELLGLDDERLSELRAAAAIHYSG